MELAIMAGIVMTILSLCDQRRMASLICRSWNTHIRADNILLEQPYTLANSL